MKYDSAQAVLQALIQAFYYERNTEKVLDCVTDDVEWVGTQEEECASGKKELKELMTQVMRKTPGPFRVTFEEPVEQHLSDTVSILSFSGKYMDVPKVDYNFGVRSTICCVKIEESWYVKNLHVSAPNVSREKHRLENELSNTRKKEIVLQNSIPGGTAIYKLKKDGRVETEYISDNLAKLSGYPSYKELLEKISYNAKNEIPTEDWDLLYDAVVEAVKKGEPINVAYHIFSSEGKKIAITMNANIMATNLAEDDLAVLYAVHTLVPEQELREQRHFRTIFNMLGIAYWEWTKNNGFYASESFKRYSLSQRPIEDIKNNKIFDDSIYPDDIKKLKEFFAHGDNREQQASVIIRMKLIDGSYRWTEIFGFKEYTEAGENIRLSCVMRDVDQEWINQKSQLEEALKDAREANQAKTEFLSRISHDMRTPLNGIKNYALFIQSAKSLEEAQGYSEKIQISESFLQTLINDTLGMSRIESGKVKLNLEPYIYEEFQPSIYNVVEPRAKEKGIQLRFSGPNGPRQHVMFDKLRLQQIFVNILNNAIKFTPSGGIVEMKIEIKNQQQNKEDIQFTISDTGIGMSREFMETQLFKPFAQEHPGQDNEQTGTGLGLSIVRQLVELMNGTIQCESVLGEGTTFIVTLPVETVDNYHEKEQREQKDHRDDLTLLKGRRILLCEDHPLNREIAIRLLKNAGCLVEIAEDGEKGVYIFKEKEENYFDAILMDVRMPHMDGLQATRTIRAMEKADAKTIPIIAMTANAFAEDVKACLEAGMNVHLAKPVEPKEMYRVLAVCIGKMN